MHHRCGENRALAPLEGEGVFEVVERQSGEDDIFGFACWRAEAVVKAAGAVVVMKNPKPGVAVAGGADGGEQGADQRRADPLALVAFLEIRKLMSAPSAWPRPTITPSTVATRVVASAD